MFSRLVPESTRPNVAPRSASPKHFAKRPTDLPASFGVSAALVRCLEPGTLFFKNQKLHNHALSILFFVGQHGSVVKLAVPKPGLCGRCGFNSHFWQLFFFQFLYY